MTRSNTAFLRAMLLVMAVPTSAATAQGLSGPLDTPSAASSPAKRATAHRAKAATAARRSTVPSSAQLPSDVPAVPAARDW